MHSDAILKNKGACQEQATKRENMPLGKNSSDYISDLSGYMGALALTVRAIFSAKRAVSLEPSLGRQSCTNEHLQKVASKTTVKHKGTLIGFFTRTRG